MKRRFVATIEWLRLWPNDGFFPQIAHTLDTAASVAEAGGYPAAARSWAKTSAISSAVRDQALLRHDTTENKITVVHNGIPSPSIDSLAPPAQVHAALHLDPETPFIFCAARLRQS